MMTVNLQTHARSELVDVTAQVADAVRQARLRHGAVLVYCPHTTAGVTINENADPSVRNDLSMTLEKLVPHSLPFTHREGNADAHVKASLVGSSMLVPVEDGELRLGTWQGIFFCEFDGPRRRRLLVQPLPAS